MDNDYIKGLEKRIETLEKIINQLTIENHTAINISNCQIQAVGLEKCKNTSFINSTIDTCAPVGYKNIIANSNINHLTPTGTGKEATYNNCKFYTNDKE